VAYFVLVNFPTAQHCSTLSNSATAVIRQLHKNKNLEDYEWQKKNTITN
jgi:hypothetical protein